MDNDVIGGVHPDISKLIDSKDTVCEKFTASALKSSENLKEKIASLKAENAILAGFNYTDCVTQTALCMRSGNGILKQNVTILQDAAADNKVIEEAELWDDTGAGESSNALLRYLNGINSKKSEIVMQALGL
jgi:nicotinamidase-related amidase